MTSYAWLWRAHDWHNYSLSIDSCRLRLVITNLRCFAWTGNDVIVTSSAWFSCSPIDSVNLSIESCCLQLVSASYSAHDLKPRWRHITNCDVIVTQIVFYVISGNMRLISYPVIPESTFQSLVAIFHAGLPKPKMTSQWCHRCVSHVACVITSIFQLHRVT